MKRYHSTKILTNRGNEDYIEIYDDDWGGSSTEFTVGRDGYRLRYDGSSSLRFQPVTPSSLIFEMMVENSTHEGFITLLTSSREGRFKVKLIRNGSLRWAGLVTIDIGVYEDMPKPYGFEVACTDLGTLATIDYKDVTGPYDGWKTFIEHTIEILDKTGLPAFAWSSGTMLSTVADWYEDSMGTTAADDPIALTRCHHRAFYDVDNAGSFKYMSCLDVLRQLMQIMGCNLKQSGGQFWIFQIPQYNEANPTARHYDGTGTYTSNSSINYTTEIDQTNTGARLAGGKYTWLPPLKEVKLRYLHRNWTNIISGASWSNGTADYEGPELVADANPFALNCSFTITRTLVNGSNPTGQPYFEKYRFKFQVGSYYLRRAIIQVANGTIQYETATWTTTPSEYFFHIVNDGYFPTLGGSGTLSNSVSFTVPHFPADGASYLNVQNEGFVTMTGSGAGITFGAASTITGYVAINAGGDATDTSYTVTNDSTSANSTTIELTSQIGSGTTVNSIGKLQVYNGSTWTDANVPDGWTIGGSGDETTLQQLLITEIMAGQKIPVEKMLHTVGYTNYEPHERLDDDSNSKIWAFLTGEYIAAFDDWQGEWYFIQRDATEITADTPVEIPSSGGITPAPSFPHGPFFPPIEAPVPPQSPDFPSGGDPDGFVLNGLSGITTATGISIGTITTISLNQTIRAGGYVAGQQITVIDPINNLSQTFTVTSDSAEGDTSLSVSGYAIANFAPNSVIITPQSNYVLSGSGSGSSSGEALSEWETIWQQHGSVDNTNDPNFPFESANAGLETDENAGDGATAGLRIDGDGIQSYTASSSTPGVKIGTDGKLYMAGLATGTNNVALVLEGGVVKQQTITSGATDHGALTGLTDDDHAQYLLLNGRAGGQNVIGGTAANDDLVLQSTSNVTRGDIRIIDTLQLDTITNGTSNYIVVWNNSTAKIQYVLAVNSSAGAGDAGKLVKLDAGGKVDASMIDDADVDHGSIGGLGDDDHTQYVLLAGRSGGQTIYGGTAAGNNLNLYSTSNVTKGRITAQDDLYNASSLYLITIQNAGNGSTAGIRFYSSTGFTSYNNSSTTPLVNIDNTGAWSFKDVPTAGNGSTAGIIISSSSGISGYVNTSANPMYYLSAAGIWQFYSVPTVGNGSTAGIKVTNANGIQAYKSTSSTPTLEIKTDGTFIFNHAAHPTVSSGIFYVNNGVIHLNSTGTGSKVHPQYGHIRQFSVIGLNTNWSTGAKDIFWKITSEYAGYEVWQVGFGVGASAGSGTSTNQCYVYHSNAAGSSTTTIYQMTCDTTASTIATASSFVSLASGDYIYFNVSSIKSTPAQGLSVELYLRKT